MYSKEVIDKVIESLAKGKDLNEIAEKYQVSRSTIYNWNKKYSNEIEKLGELIELSKKIKILIKLGRLEEALELCTEEVCLKNLAILSQKITILIKLGRLEESLELCAEEVCLKNLAILSQKIKILIKLRRLKKALELCTEEACQNSLYILSQKITILIKLGRLEEALELCTEEACKGKRAIKNKKYYIYYIIHEVIGLSSYKNIEDIVVYEGKNLNSIESELITKLYLNKLREDEIKDSSLIEWYKEVLLIGHYEKNNKSKGVQFIKGLKEKYKENQTVLKNLNKLMDRLISKNKFFDISIYEKLLSTSVNFEKIEEYSQKELDVDYKRYFK